MKTHFLTDYFAAISLDFSKMKYVRVSCTKMISGAGVICKKLVKYT